MAYERYLADDGRTAGRNGIPRYADDLDGVPRVCVKVPTGGGKTYIAANALGVICDELPEEPSDVVVWLVPRQEILAQTYRRLSNPTDPLRMAIDVDFAHQVEVLRKEDGLAGRGFNRSTVEDQLTLFVLSYDSFKSAKSRRLAFAENSSLAQLTDYQRATGQAHAVAGADETALVSALAGTHPIVVVDESHHATSPLSQDMLRNLNPRFVLELTATPRDHANVIVRVPASDLKAEEMVKLPAIVYRRPDKSSVVVDAIHLQRRLEQEAVRCEEQGGPYIRPIVLLQAERRDATDATTYERLRQQLVDAGIPADQVAVRTGEVNELGDTDLMSRDCPIRFIITVEALAEGWDCPFAYVLATVANKSSQLSVEQVVGRVLRQPHATRSVSSALNVAYVLTCSDDLSRTVDQVVAGLNAAGFSRTDVQAGADVAPALSQEPPSGQVQAQLGYEGDSQGDGKVEGGEEGSGSAADGGEEPLDLSGLGVAPSIGNANAGSMDVDALVSDAAEREGAYERQTKADVARDGVGTTGLGDDNVKGHFQLCFKDDVKGLRIPQFVVKARKSLFTQDSDLGEQLFDKSMLLECFDLGACGTDLVQISLDDSDARQVDVDEASTDVKVRQLDKAQQQKLRSLFGGYSVKSKREQVAGGIVESMSSQFRITYGEASLRAYVRRVVDRMDEAELDGYVGNVSAYVQAFADAIRQYAEQWQRDEFEKRLDSGAIRLEPWYVLPPSISTNRPTTIYDRTLYEAEDAGMNDLERKMAEALAGCGRILWWHRVREKGKTEFSINGFIRHYPDFIARTRGGTILAIETKGEHLKNDDSEAKLALGRTWANMAGGQYRYFMVFDHDPLLQAGAYAMAEFRADILDELE